MTMFVSVAPISAAVVSLRVIAESSQPIVEQVHFAQRVALLVPLLSSCYRLCRFRFRRLHLTLARPDASVASTVQSGFATICVGSNLPLPLVQWPGHLGLTSPQPNGLTCLL